MASNFSSITSERAMIIISNARVICGSLRSSKDILRSSGLLIASLDAFLSDSVHFTFKDRLCDFLRFACSGNDRNRKLIASSDLICFVLNEGTRISLSHELRLKLCNLLASVCTQDDQSDSNHVSVWNRDKLMYFFSLMVPF